MLENYIDLFYMHSTIHEKFCTKLWHNISLLTDRPEDKENNVLFSPSSILTGIGMLFRGMEGQTRENVRRIMGFPSKDNPKIFRDAFKVCSDTQFLFFLKKNFITT